MLVEATFNRITHNIIGAAIEVHRNLGPGLLESVYMPCLQYELATRKLRFVAERSIPIIYKEMQLDARYRVDLLVEEVVIVEVKSIDCVMEIHKAQVLTYMRLTGCPAGLVINFNVAKLIDGVTRLIETRQ